MEWNDIEVLIATLLGLSHTQQDAENILQYM